MKYPMFPVFFREIWKQFLLVYVLKILFVVESGKKWLKIEFFFLYLFQGEMYSIGKWLGYQENMKVNWMRRAGLCFLRGSSPVCLNRMVTPL